LREGLICFRPRHGQLSVVIRTPLHVRSRSSNQLA
jgi:hypothetical protein